MTVTEEAEIPSAKPKIIFFCFDLLSHYLRCLQLADAIKEDYDIYFISSLYYNDFIIEKGFSLVEAPGIMPLSVLYREMRFDHSWISVERLEKVFLDQVTLIQKLKPKVVVGDFALTLPMSAEFTNTKSVMLMNGYFSKYYQVNRKPPKNHPAVKALSLFMPQRPLEKVVGMVEKIVFRRMHKPFNELRRIYNLSPRKNYLDEFEGDYNLICDAPFFTPQQRLPANYYFVGPIYHCGGGDESELRNRLDPNKKTIYVSMGSSGDLKKVEFLNDPHCYASHSLRLIPPFRLAQFRGF